VSGEAYVGGKITMENNVNNKVLYEPATSVADPLTASDFTVLVLIAEHSLSSSCAQFHRFYCGSLQMEVGNQTLVMKGSINRLFIEERIMEQLNRA
jgi:hypothetical protein